MKRLKASVGTEQVLVLESFHSPIPQRVEPSILDLHVLQNIIWSKNLFNEDYM